MRRRVQRWGNSLAVRIPAEIARVQAPGRVVEKVLAKLEPLVA